MESSLAASLSFFKSILKADMVTLESEGTYGPELQSQTEVGERAESRVW